MIVLNSLKDEGAGFQKDTNKIKILTKTEQKEFSLKSKEDVAKDILDFVEEKFNKNKKIVFKTENIFNEKTTLHIWLSIV
jgi:hypothetical protein